MSLQKSPAGTPQWTYDAVYHFQESYVRATDLVNELFRINEDMLAQWVWKHTNRWRNYKKTVKYVDNCLVKENHYGKKLSNHEWHRRILILLGRSNTKVV